MSYQGGGKLVLPGSPGVLRKNKARIVYAGKHGRCRSCGKPLGDPIPVQAKLPSGTVDAVVDAAFAADLRPLSRTAGLATISHWPRVWGEDGRAPGRPCGDVDAPVSGLLDVLANVLYRDDAQVGLLVAANAYDPARPRIECAARPLSPAVLAAIAEWSGLPFDTARLTLGEQGRLLP